jgi:RNA polymerase sporulation-specific sigma factor
MLQSYLEELRKTKLLEPKEEQLLWERVAKGDVDAHQKLMVAYQPLVFKLAISFQLQENETMELVQEGMVGLLESAENYDYTRGVAFSVFATFRIKGRMLDYLKKTNNGVLYLEGDLGSGLTLGETLASGQVSPTEYAERQLLHDKVTQALGRLPEKEQKVITCMYLEDRPAQAVAEAIDISLGHVYRLQKKGVRRIRGMLSRFIHDFNKS